VEEGLRKGTIPVNRSTHEKGRAGCPLFRGETRQQPQTRSQGPSPNRQISDVNQMASEKKFDTRRVGQEGSSPSYQAEGRAKTPNGPESSYGNHREIQNPDQSKGIVQAAKGCHLHLKEGVNSESRRWSQDPVRNLATSTPLAARMGEPLRRTRGPQNSMNSQ